MQLFLSQIRPSGNVFFFTIFFLFTNLFKLLLHSGNIILTGFIAKYRVYFGTHHLVKKHFGENSFYCSCYCLVIPVQFLARRITECIAKSWQMSHKRGDKNGFAILRQWDIKMEWESWHVHILKNHSSPSSLLRSKSRCRLARPPPPVFWHSNLQPVKARCRAITQALISRKICIIHGARRVPRTIFREGRRTSAIRALARDRPLENSPLLEFVRSIWGAVSPGGWGAFRRTRRGSFEISKWINFIDRIAAHNRDAGDETTLIPVLIEKI